MHFVCGEYGPERSAYPRDVPEARCFNSSKWNYWLYGTRYALFGNMYAVCEREHHVIAYVCSIVRLFFLYFVRLPSTWNGLYCEIAGKFSNISPGKLRCEMEQLLPLWFSDLSRHTLTIGARTCAHIECRKLGIICQKLWRKFLCYTGLTQKGLIWHTSLLIYNNNLFIQYCYNINVGWL